MLLGEEWGGEVLLIGRSGWRCHVTFKKNWAEHLRPREWQEVERACASARRVGSSQGGQRGGSVVAQAQKDRALGVGSWNLCSNFSFLILSPLWEACSLRSGLAFGW